MSRTQSLNSEGRCAPFACLPSQGKQTSGNGMGELQLSWRHGWREKLGKLLDFIPKMKWSVTVMMLQSYGECGR